MENLPYLPTKPNNKFLKIFIVLFLIFLLGSLCFFFIKEVVQINFSKNSVSPSPSDSSKTPNEPIKGYSFSPKSYDTDGFSNFYKLVTMQNLAITWAGDWQELATNNKFPSVFARQAKNYSFTPVFITSVYNPSTKQLIRPFTQENLYGYKKAATDFAKQQQPAYLGLGSEINLLYEVDKDLFNTFVTLFSETYDEVKKVSPHTQIFTTFQLEKLKGLKGGLFGGKNDENSNEWNLLNSFEKSDFYAFTTYPYLIYKNPINIPNDYYIQILQKTKKKLAFVEIGWPSGNIASGYESTQEEQVEFQNIFLAQTQNLNKALVIWPFLYDTDTNVPFKSLGLISADGTKKLSWENWQKYLK